MRADLHVHTYYSDGLQSPDDVAAAAKAVGVAVVSVTDHDTCLAYPEFFARCAERGIKGVRGIEISAYHKGVRVHTLGYNPDPNNPVFADFLKELYEGSLLRADDMLSKLNANGIRLTLDDVLKYRKGENSPVHAMHVARAGAEKGYSSAPFAFHREYLSRGGVGYSELCRPSPETATEIIAACSGFAVLAHPGRLELDGEETLSLLKRMIGCGLRGIEGVYSAHTPLQTAYYKEIAREYGLTVTGGSDTHFKGGGKAVGTPVFDCDDELCEKLGIS